MQSKRYRYDLSQASDDYTDPVASVEVPHDQVRLITMWRFQHGQTIHTKCCLLRNQLWTTCKKTLFCEENKSGHLTFGKASTRRFAIR